MASLLSSSISLFSNSTRFHSFHSSALDKNPRVRIRTVSAAEPEKEKVVQTSGEESSSSGTAPSKKPVYSMKKGQIVRVDKEKYLNSINYLSVGHPPYYKGLDYIYEDRGEVLDIRIFETGEHALLSYSKGRARCTPLLSATVYITDCLGWNSHSTCMVANRYAYQVRKA